VPPFALPHTNQLLEDHPLWDAGLVATERVVRLSLGQEDTKLLEDELDEILSLLKEALSAAHLSVLCTLKRTRARS
jgi:hypothetical protein